MKKIAFTLFVLLLLSNASYAQFLGFKLRNDTTKNRLGIRERRLLALSSQGSLFDPAPLYTSIDVKFDPVLKIYTIQKLIGGKPYSSPQYLTMEQYERLSQKEILKKNWTTFSNIEAEEYRSTGILPLLTIDNKVFNRIFGGSEISVQPRGQIDLGLLYKISKNDNPLLTESQRSQSIFDFDMRIQTELITSVGRNFKFNLKYNTESQFAFENQVKLDFLGNSEAINVNKIATTAANTAKDKVGEQLGMKDIQEDVKTAKDASGKVNNALSQKPSSRDNVARNTAQKGLTGSQDNIIKRIEAGNISFPLQTSLISGSQALYGIKTQLQFGKLNIAAVISKQKSQANQITLNNGVQQHEIKLTASAYDANRHYFLANFFRDNYNKAMSVAPLILSNVLVTKVEVWVTNKAGKTTDSRDVLALLDLGENDPYNKAQITGGGSVYPAAFTSPNFSKQSNNLLSNLPSGARFSNSNDVATYFQANGGGDNYAKMTYARRLSNREFSYHSQLGYITLNTALNNDEVLAVAFRYSYNGVEYQVGEFATDIPFDQNTPKVLFAKLLKNEIVKTSLPTWNLMMKNIYAIGGTRISDKDFKLDVLRVDDNTGVERPILLEGKNTANKLWLSIVGLDRLNQQRDAHPDGIFDFEIDKRAFSDNPSSTSTNGISGLPSSGVTNSPTSTNGTAFSTISSNVATGYATIDPINGRIIFPVLEPFGRDLEKQFDAVTESNLIEKYTFKPLYDSTRTTAQQLFAVKDKYSFKIRYQGESSAEISLNSINVPVGSVKVLSGNIPLQEGVDYTVDYAGGRVYIINPAVLTSGQPISVSSENSELYGLQDRSLYGTRLDYAVNSKLNIGGTILRLVEKPISQKVSYAQEPIANTIFGFDFNYSDKSRFITKMVDKLPFLSTKAPSEIKVYGEYARFIPGHSSAINANGKTGGVSYIDDFEAAKWTLDLAGATAWRLSGTPSTFPESNLTNDLAYGFNRAKLAFYNVDPAVYDPASNLFPSSFKNNLNEFSNHYVRQVLSQEVFPYKDIPLSQRTNIITLDLAYYPKRRGPYNFAPTGFDSNGLFINPKSKWGGMFRAIQSNDFEALNIGYIEFFVLDPFLYNTNATGGDLYINLGNMSEDILKDGRKSLENALPTDGDVNKYDVTNWGKVARLQPVIPSFDNDPAARKLQDVGLDGLSDEEEKQKFASNLATIKAGLNAQAAQNLDNDPASDDFTYFRGGNLDNTNAGILKRYESYNNPDGNSKTPQQARDELGIDNAAATSIPDGEDINQDNNMTTADAYYQYKVSMRPADLVVGKNFITDKIVSDVKLANGDTQTVTWYQFRVPIDQYTERVGNIQDFRSIRFMRLFLTDFTDETVLRFAQLQLVRGDWRIYNAKNQSNQIIVEPSVVSPTPDVSSVDIATIGINENGKRVPIPYVLPPNVTRERDYTDITGVTKKNEQSLLMKVENLRDGYGRAVFKTVTNDFRSYKHLEMYVHAEAIDNITLEDNDVNAFVRIGTDNQDNYYEYEKPLKVTLPGTADPYAIWPEQNNIDIELDLLQNAKRARNAARDSNGNLWSLNVPYTYVSGNTTITIKGQPDLSKVRVMMLGVKNPIKKGDDSFLDKSALIWFDDLRLTQFDESGGWAATGRVSAKLADFGDFNFSIRKSTIGFGALEQKLNEQSRTDDLSFDIAANLELGKFFPKKSGIKIPTLITYSNKTSIPKYDPRSPDVLLSTTLQNTTGVARDSILNYAEDVTQRRGYSFTNVHKERSATDKTVHIWDIENFSATYTFTELVHRDYIIENGQQRDYKAALMYNYANEAKSYQPFKKSVFASKFALIKDFNFTLFPNNLNFGMTITRMYAQNSLRNADPSDKTPLFTTVNKNFFIVRNYGLTWNLSKSLTFNFDAINNGVVDEPYGVIEGAKRDTVIRNLLNFGRTVNYRHTLNLTYNLPTNKIKFLNWVNVRSAYSANYNWQSEPLVALKDPTINIGNTIQNSNILQINPSFDFRALYKKIPFLKPKTGKDNTGLVRNFFIDLLTSLKTVNITYTSSKGTFLPGYLPKTSYLGIDKTNGAPGLGFVFGSQEDIRQRAADNHWLSTDTWQNQLYVNTMREEINMNAILEPMKHLKITLGANRSRNLNYSANFMLNQQTNEFEESNAVTVGDYNISILTISTSFTDNNSASVSKLYHNFLSNKSIISQRFGQTNANSAGLVGAYADGYSKDSQNVIVASFLATYQGKNAATSSLSLTPKIPLPSWRISYDGLNEIPFLKPIFTELTLNHAFKSTYSVNGFTSLLQYKERNGAVSSRDVNQDFLPRYQFSQVTISEQFAPLIGVQSRFENNISTNFEINRTRLLGLSLLNSQLAQTSENSIVFGLGYTTNNFTFPFGLFRSFKLENTLTVRFDVAVRDNKTVIYRAETEKSEIASGAKTITFKPVIDYAISKSVNMSLFYDSNVTKPYTSQTYNTSFVTFGIRFKATFK